MKKQEPKILLRNLVVEIIIYSILIFAYYWFALRWFADWLLDVFNSNLILYAVAGLALIFVQAVILDFITSFLMRYIKLDQFGVRRILDVFSNR
jgi:hypothetical protein